MPTSVLLVDDNPLDLALIEEAIRVADWKIEIATAQHGGEALSYLTDAAKHSQLPDLVVLDLNMPKVSGWDLLAQMRSKGFDKPRRIAMTGSQRPSDCDRALVLGAAQCIQKPDSFDALVEIVQDIRKSIEAIEPASPLLDDPEYPSFS